MSLSKLRSKLYKWAKFLGDVQAIRKGRYVQRIKQRQAGKYSRRGLNKLLGK